MISIISIAILLVIAKLIIDPKNESGIKTGLIADHTQTALNSAIRNSIRDVARKIKVPENIIAAIVMVESSGDPLDVGDGGASIGLMQIQRDAFDDVQNNEQETNFTYEQMFAPIPNLIIGSLFFRLNKRRLGTLEGAIRAHNSGATGAENGGGFGYLELVKKWL